MEKTMELKGTDQMTRSQLKRLLKWYSTPPYRLRPNWEIIRKQMIAACKRYKIRIPEWLT